MVNKQAILNAVDQISNRLHHLAAYGCRGFECSRKSLATLSRWGQPDSPLPEILEDIRIDLGRKHIVFGEGSAKSRLVFVGEGPGFEEDQRGQPFVGAAGQLLTKIIVAMKLTRDQVYICNVTKCRPPGNRDPEADEIETCLPFLERQIAAIRPDFICTLGRIAAQALLKTDAPISRLRGRFHSYHGIKLLPTYHPAYLLRNPDKKRDVWNDMQMLMKEYRYEN
jgi:DNA polymerase